jgi:hypothetical protein
MVALIRGALLLTAMFLLLAAHACRSNSSNNFYPDNDITRYEGLETPQIYPMLISGVLKLDEISAIAEQMEKSEPFGEIINISVTNLTAQQQTFRVDCGTVLRAADARYQDLIVSRSTEGIVAPNAHWSGKLEVFSLQMRRHYPYKPAAYHLGHLANGDLRNFIDCFCARHPTAQDNNMPDFTPAQYAIWRIADNVTLMQVLAYARGRGNPNIDEMAAAEKLAREQGQYTDQLLDDCRISLKFLD